MARNLELKRAAGRRWYYKNKDVYRKNQAVKINRNLKYIREQKQKPCMDCGESYPHYVMDFDHRSDKTFNISNLRHHGQKVIEAEIAKCDLVCSNCHRIRTFTKYKPRTVLDSLKS